MLSQQVLTLGRDEKKIILALLLHPRLMTIRRQFQERVFEVLGDERELERMSDLSGVPVQELVARTRRMLLDMEHGAACQPDVGHMADTALTFFASPRLINLWGHFTMALQKVMLDDVTVGEVADSCGTSGLADVRSAVRQFSTESGNRRCDAEDG